MFGKLKEKLKGAFSKFSKDLEESSEEITILEESIQKKPIKENNLNFSKDVLVSSKDKSSEVKVSKEKNSKNLDYQNVSIKKEKLTKIPNKKEGVKNKSITKKEIKAEITENDLVDSENISVVEDYSKEVVLPITEPKKGFFKKLFSKQDSDELINIEQKETEILEKEIKTLENEQVLEKIFSELPDDEKNQIISDEEELISNANDDLIESEKQIEKLEEKKKSIFSKVTESITKRKISDEKFEDLFFDIEVVLLENNVSFDVVQKIKDDLKIDLVNKPLDRNKISEIILKSLKMSINSLFDLEKIDFIKLVESKSPFVISFIGVNGSGKTTNLAKVAHLLKKSGKTCVIAACDTFRSAAIQQLEEHANNLNIKLIKHDYGADSAAVAFDAIEHAKSKKIDVVLLDTAGRLHSNVNLMNELKKLMKVAKPDFNIFVGESITGNDCIEQAVLFKEAVNIDGIILTKADVDEKGGAPLSISYVTKKPILFLGNGQDYEDLVVFDKKMVLDNLGLD